MTCVITILIVWDSVLRFCWLFLWFISWPVVVLSLPQGSVSFIVMDSWIMSTCVRTEPVAPAGTKRRHISAGPSWVTAVEAESYGRLTFSVFVFKMNWNIIMFVCLFVCLCLRTLLWRSVAMKDSGLCGADCRRHCELLHSLQEINTIHCFQCSIAHHIHASLHITVLFLLLINLAIISFWINRLVKNYETCDFAELKVSSSSRLEAKDIPLTMKSDKFKLLLLWKYRLIEVAEDFSVTHRLNQLNVPARFWNVSDRWTEDFTITWFHLKTQFVFPTQFYNINT